MRDYCLSKLQISEHHKVEKWETLYGGRCMQTGQPRGADVSLGDGSASLWSPRGCPRAVPHSGTSSPSSSSLTTHCTPSQDSWPLSASVTHPPICPDTHFSMGRAAFSREGASSFPWGGHWRWHRGTRALLSSPEVKSTSIITEL